MLVKLHLHVFAQVDVSVHLTHLTHIIMAALYLQLLDHELFRLLRDRAFVEEPLSKLFFISLDKHVAPMQAAEQINDGSEALFHLEVCDTF